MCGHETRDDGTESQGDEWWMHLEDGRMDPDVHDQRRCSPSECSLTNTDLVLIPGKPRCINPSNLNAIQIMFLLSICAFTFTGVDWNLRCMIPRFPQSLY